MLFVDQTEQTVRKPKGRETSLVNEIPQMVSVKSDLALQTLSREPRLPTPQIALHWFLETYARRSQICRASAFYHLYDRHDDLVYRDSMLAYAVNAVGLAGLGDERHDRQLP